MSRTKRPPIRTDSTENADQAEVAAFLNNEAPIAAGVYDEKLASADEDYRGEPALREATWERDKTYEEAVGATATEIDRRAGLLRAAYPFRREHGRLVYTPQQPYLYEFLLCLSMAPSYSSGRFRILPRVFEVISCKLAEAYLGGETGSYRMGWPRPAGSPTTLKAAVEELRMMCGEHTGDWHWHPKEGNPIDPTPQVAKEQGLDVVAWKKSPDGRAGQLYLLGQCACGKNWDSDAKLQDLNIKTLQEWISEISSVDPVRAIFTPRHALDERLPFLSRHAGMVFDRVRLTLLASHPTPAAMLALRQSTLTRLSTMCVA